MARLAASIALLAAVALAAAPGAAARPLEAWLDRQRCPPPGFDALQDFNVTQYIAQRWFVQKQEPLVYQPADRLFCVFAEYQPLREDPLDGLLVNNYANEGAVNGPVVGTSEVADGPLTTATIPNKRRPSKLRVAISLGGGESFRPIQLGRGGDYWVVAAGQSVDPADRSGNLYDWAIVTGGRPNRRSNGACATGSPFGLVRRFQTNNVGLWLFTRKPIDPVNTQLMMGKLAELGLDPSGLLDVQQQGCTYACGPGSGQCN
ncbi:hypothetical protein COHA_001493 [Chlorella ohadii]|uniref:Uncharacterized protein n=1 Tax=Chlorella ohadii TaxID=2649997 RepID=A0AAD5DYV2_9CHLO|nr:hypothetical protein COHA_001493 [Chlorella ohadii]